MKYIILLALIIEITSFTNEETTTWNYLVNAGLTKAGAAGLMGNLKGESGVKSVYYENSYKKRIGMTDQEYVDKVNNGEYSEYNFVHDNVGFGIALWTYHTRKQNLYNACHGKIGDLNCQLEYLVKELKTYYSTLYRTLTSSNDIIVCTRKVVLTFERASYNVQKRRISYAQAYYNAFAGVKSTENSKDETTKKPPIIRPPQHSSISTTKPLIR